MLSQFFQSKFKIHQLVLVKYNDVCYIGKVLDIEESEGSDVKYKIHYQGWSKICDEWIFEKQILNINVNTFNNAKNTKSLALHYPKVIQKLLNDDSNNIKNKKIVDIPRKNGQTIHDILIDYSATYDSKKNIVKKQIINQIRFYFNESLSTILLYNNERSQYYAVSNNFNNLAMDQIYGVEHLCRLFVKLPKLISSNDLNYATKIKFEEIINDLMRYIGLKLFKYVFNY